MVFIGLSHINAHLTAARIFMGIPCKGFEMAPVVATGYKALKAIEIRMVFRVL
jgi:hypothetical protein